MGYGWTSQRLWEPEGATGGETETERGCRGGKGFSINKTAGQILAGLWKHLHPVPEASSELLLAHYWQLVLWAQPEGRGALLALTPLDTHTHTMNQADNFAQACPPSPAVCVEQDARVYMDEVCECMCVHMKLSHGRKCEGMLHSLCECEIMQVSSVPL